MLLEELEELVAPVVEKLKAHAKEFVANKPPVVSQDKLLWLSSLLYFFIKFRGYKTISASLDAASQEVTEATPSQVLPS